MAKSSPSRASKASAGKRPAGTRGGASKRGAGAKSVSTDGKQLVIVESPAKAKTINKYLGPEYVVQASVGHVRDLPSKAPKGSKQPVPGVDLENRFEPTYEVLPGKKKVVTDLKRAAKKAAAVWFATDLDREGEAIAWHLAQEMGINAKEARRVVFNAITKSEIERAFRDPHPIDEDRVNAQQARRILDRIVGYQVSPLLWKKVARGLSAGRVQSVAVRLVVEREREIQAFVPDESWRVMARFTPEIAKAAELGLTWNEFMARFDEKGNPPTLKAQDAWIAQRGGFKAELVEVEGEKFDLGLSVEKIIGPLTDLSPPAIKDRLERAARAFNDSSAHDLAPEMSRVAEVCGLRDVRVSLKEAEDARGPARWERTLEAQIAPGVRYRVKSIETKRTTSRPSAPFITSTLQMAASTAIGMGAKRTMGVAQSLYETGFITYMRTDSTYLSGEAIAQARSYIKETHSSKYLPEKPNVYGSSASAQEAHEAIRPTDAWRHPDSFAEDLTVEQLKLYRLIWNRFISCQMLPALWDSTSVLLERFDQKTGAVFKTTGRVLVFDGFYRVAGVPTAGEEQKLPALAEKQELAPFSIQPEQLFTSPPPRYTEASLVKTLEAEGIGRPSTYASIIQVIQDRNYVEQVDRRFYATDLGEVVTDKLMEGFPRLMDIGYTRVMEGELDRIANQHADWREMLADFYQRFSEALDHAHETMTHAKAEIHPAPYQCPVCGARTAYRFGKNGRFLSCSRYPDCDYAAPIDREGRPMLPEQVNVACPEDGSPMMLRTGRFGKFLASVNYPETKCVINLDRKEQIKYPSPAALVTDLTCPKCEAPLNLRRGKRGPWLGCSKFPKCRGRLAWGKVEAEKQNQLEKQLLEHEKRNPQVEIRTLDGRVIPEGTPVADLIIPGGVAKLEIHPEAEFVQPEAA